MAERSIAVYVRYVAWATLLLAAIVTISPIGFRPIIFGGHLDRFGAFCLLGLLLGCAYPKLLPWLPGILIGGAAIFEFGQSFVPGRHGHPPDVLFKGGGALLGVSLAWLVNRRFA